MLGALTVLLAAPILRAQQPPVAEPDTSVPPGPAAPDSAPAPEPTPDMPPPPAEPPPPLAESPLTRPKMDLTVPEPPAPVVRKYHHHDGFYLRANVGLVSGRASVSTDSLTHPNYSVAGGGIALDLLVGGTPSPGLALGGALMLQGFEDGDVHVDGPGADGGSGSAGLTLLGIFVDGFPRANGGLHFGGLLGLAGGSTTRQDDSDEFNGGGLGMAAWIGHGFWVGSEWSLGGLLRLNGALLREEPDEDAADQVVLANTSYGIALLFTALYH